MSAAFVPGRILLSALASSFPCSSDDEMGNFGPIWTSAMGGGLGRRGELEGDATLAMMVDG